MAKKSVGDKATYKSKGMKAPRPEKGPKMDQSMAPSHKPSMKKSHPQMYSAPKGGEQSMAPSHKKQGLTMEHAPKGVSSVNSGSDVKLPKSGCPGESEV